MAIVNGKDVILSIATGGGFDPILCNASCSINFSTDSLETTFEDDGAYRGFVPNKHTVTLKGNGPIQLGENYTAAQIVEFELARTIISWKFEFDDGTNTVIFSGTGFFTAIDITGDAGGSPATVDYTIQVTGEVSVDDTPPPGGSGTPAIWTYTATGGETTIGDPDLLNALILDVEREGIGLEIITAGSPTGNQVKSTPTGGTLEFGYALGAGEFINVLYLE